MVDSPPFRQRILALLQRSRKALRLYSSVARVGSPQVGEFAEKQAAEWKETNATLVRELSQILEKNGNSIRDCARLLFQLADTLQEHWRTAESELGAKQCNLIFAAENGDFSRAAVLSQELVSLKARMQAKQAAHHELTELLASSRMARPTTVEVEQEQNYDGGSSLLVSSASESAKLSDEHRQGSAKVIPLRRVRFS